MVEERLRRMGAEVRSFVIDGSAPILYAELGQGARTMLVYNHYDVQPPDPLDEWESAPFEPTVRDGRIYARGVADDKGDLLCRLQAVEGIALDRRPLLANLLARHRGSELANRDLRAVLDCSDSTAKNILRRLCTAGLVTASGRRGGRRYLVQDP